MKKILITALLLTLFSGLSAQEDEREDIIDLTSDGSLKIGELMVNQPRLGVYEKFEITFDLEGEWDNPFDPEQIKVDAVFKTPDGRELVMPGFFFQDYRLVGRRHEAVGAPLWKVRFSPMMEGEYQYHVVANNRGKEVKSPVGSFSCESYNTHHGFIKVSDDNPLYFEYSDGSPFVGIALGRSQGDDGGSYQRFSDAGGNFNRLFLTNGNFNLEELLPRNPRPDLGLGKMNLECAWNLDRVMELGEKLGIYHILTLTNQWTFNHRWDSHTYNKANGGVLNSKNEYFTNEEAMRYFERRLRYLVARWAYSPSLATWDLWNEYSAMGADLDLAIAWHKRMADYINSLDVFDHIIHTNDGSLNGRDEMHALPQIDVVSTNIYGVKDIARVGEDWTKRMTREFRKPFILTEFGPGHGIGNYGKMDPERRMVHNGLWSPLMSGSATTGMAWEGSWLGHEKFYTYVEGVAKFVEDIPFHEREWKPLKVGSFGFAGSKRSYYADVLVDGWVGNFVIPAEKIAKQEFFTINADGSVEPQNYLSAVLNSPKEKGRSWLTAPYGSTPSVSFKVNFPTDGEFVVYVAEVREPEPTPQLTVSIDKKKVLKKDLLPLDQDGYQPRAYNQSFSVKVPAGAHTIRVENTGGGAFTTAYELKNYVPRQGPDLQVRGLQTEDYILVWLKNPKFTIMHEMANVPMQKQGDGLLTLQDVPTGTWLAEWLNTVDGSFIRREVVKSSGNKLVLETPAVTESVAVRLQKVGNGE